MPPLLGVRRVNPHDPQVLQTIEDCAAEGLTVPTIANRIGVSPQALYNWLEAAAGEYQGGDPWPELGSLVGVLDALERGIARFEETRLARITAAATNEERPQWQAAAWQLERSPATKKRWAQLRQSQEDVRVTIDTPELPAAAATELLDIVRDRLQLTAGATSTDDTANS